jgi:hypothetical protein
MRNLSLKKPILAYFGSALLSVVMLVFVMQLWRADLKIPFNYWEGSDNFLNAMLVKGVVDNGWYQHNRYLGMPFGQELYDFPFMSNLDVLIMKAISIFDSNYAFILNVFFLLTFPLTVITSLFVFRRYKFSFASAIVGSLLFSFVPFHFIHQSHIFLASYFLVPLVVMVSLRICMDQPLFGPSRDSSRPWYMSEAFAAVIICILVGSAGSGVYYAFFACFFLLMAGFIGFFRNKKGTPLFISAILIAVICFSLFLNLLPSIKHILVEGRNKTVAVRNPESSEIYGLKISQILLPVSYHRSKYLEELKKKYDTKFPLVNENFSISLGFIGGVGFLALVGWLVFMKFPKTRTELLTGLAELNMSAVLLGTIGGFGSLFAFFISPQIRAYNRIGIYIAFFSFFAVIYLLEKIREKWATSPKKTWGYYGIVTALLFLGVWDQTYWTVVPPFETLPGKYKSDEKFIGAIQSSVPKDSWVFQLPYTPFPENPPEFQMIDYDHFMGYLHSSTLHWSYGAMKGRKGDQWQQWLMEKPLQDVLETLAFSGFNGIYLDRKGYPDRGAEMERRIGEVLRSSPLVSEDQRLVFFNMAAFNQDLKKSYSPEAWEEMRFNALHPLYLKWAGGFSFLEGGPEPFNWRWSSASGELIIDNPYKKTREIGLEMTLSTGHQEFSDLKIESPLFSEALRINSQENKYYRKIQVPPGSHSIRFFSNAPKLSAENDDRELVFQVINFRIKDLK